jgi:hypothetical protein
MGAPIPQVLLEAIASAAGSGFITNPMPNAPTGSNAASIEAGFPPITMQSELAGGEPPLGQDMNGFLYLISSHTFYVQSGQPYMYNVNVATAIGGYAVGTILGMTDGTGLWLCTAANNTSNPDANGAGWVALKAYGSITVPVTGGTTTLTPAQYKYGVIILTGALASNQFLILPTTVQEWLIINNTTGSFTTTAITAASGSTGVVLTQGGFGAPTRVYSIGDGNIYPSVAPLSLNISVAPTANSIVQRSNAGYVLATYFNTSAGIDNLTPVSVFTNSGDGYLRQNSLTNFESFLLLQGIGGQVTNGQVPYSVVQQWASTFLNNAALTGTPTAPTPAAGDNSTKIATTAFVAGVASLVGNGYYRASNGWTIQWGLANPPGQLITFGSTPGTIAMTLLAAVATGIAGGAVQAWVDSGTLTSTSFKVNTSGGNAFWIAVGHQ